jgi:hypothetical protein
LCLRKRKGDEIDGTHEVAKKSKKEKDKDGKLEKALKVRLASRPLYRSQFSNTSGKKPQGSLEILRLTAAGELSNSSPAFSQRKDLCLEENLIGL